MTTLLAMRGKVRSCILTLLACALISVNASDAPAAAPDKAKALEAVKTYVAEAASSGKKVDVWITMFGALTKTELVKSDAKSITVNVQKNPFDTAWEKLSTKDTLSVAKACIQENGKRAMLLADYCLAIGELDEADKLIIAFGQDKALAADVKARTDVLAALKAAAKPAAPAVATPAAPAGDGSTPNRSALAAAGLAPSAAPGGPELIPYKGPEKLAFRPSEPGNLTPVKEVIAAVDNAIEIGLAEMGIHPEPLCDDPAFLRRATLDLTGQIPSPEEVIGFLREGNTSQKRQRKIDELLQRPEYADNMATFWTVLLVGRKTNDNADIKPPVFRNWLRGEFAKNSKFSKIVTDILTATGENDKNGPVNYLTFHMNDTLPITMGHISQSFLGARIGCAQCHDHPFDKWTQQDFWGFAGFLANTRSDRRELREDPKDPARITKQWHILTDQNERNGGGKYDPPQNDLRLPAKYLDGPVFSPPGAKVAGKDMKGGKDSKGGMNGDMSAMKKDSKGGDMSAMKKDSKGGAGMGMDGMSGGIAKGMDEYDPMIGGTGSDGKGKPAGLGLSYRKALAAWITSNQNERFAQSAVNRMWRNMFGYGLVEPIDDIRPKNPPVYPDVMNILASDFAASGHDMQRLLTIIANTKAYQRQSAGTMAKIDRQRSVRYFARAEVRPMTPEMLLAAIEKVSGGEEKAKAMSATLRARDEAMMDGGMGGMAMGNEYNDLMRRFIGTSTAEDRAGKLQFEGTVAQALMMMHSDFMMTAIAKGTKRFEQNGQGGLVFLFAATLGRPPTDVESSAFAARTPNEQLWILLNSAEFMSIH